MESFYRENSSKTLNESAAITEAICHIAIPSEKQQNEHPSRASFTFRAKKS